MYRRSDLLGFDVTISYALPARGRGNRPRGISGDAARSQITLRVGKGVNIVRGGYCRRISVDGGAARRGSHEADEAGAVDARAAAAEEAEYGDGAADEDEERRKLLEQRHQPRRRHRAQQVDVDGRLRVDVHPETDAEHRAAAHLSTTTASVSIAGLDILTAVKKVKFSRSRYRALGP